MRVEMVGILFYPVNPIISRPSTAVEDVLQKTSCHCIVHTEHNDAFGVLYPVIVRLIGFSVYVILLLVIS